MNKIHHLFQRAGFGLSPKEWQERKTWSVTQAVDFLFAEAKVIPTLQEHIASVPAVKPMELSKEAKDERRKMERQLVIQQNIAWIERMASQDHSALLERMSLFWHGHFACQTKVSNLAQAQLNTIRKHATGNFRDLVLAIARDVSMIRFLNNQQNRKKSPNENFARELMELFTIGRGHYTEQDIKEAARAFTGWSSNLQGEYVFRQRQHDYGQKTFFGKTGNFDGEDIIDMILEKRETADFITKKIYRHFVNEAIDEAIVSQLSQVFYNSNYDISLLLQNIFTSDWFYQKANVGTKIKSPIELMAGMMRILEVDFEQANALLFVQKALGQTLFDPPNVAGWAGGKSWIDNSTLMLRLNLATYLFTSSDVNLRTKAEFEAKTRGKATKKLNAKINLQPILEMTKGLSEDAVFQKLVAYLLPQEAALSKATFDQYIPSRNHTEYVRWLTMRLMSLPEFQMC